MTTLATLKAKIASRLRRSDLTTEIAEAIQDAIQQWEGERFAFNELRFRVNTVANQEEYTFPDDLLAEDGSALSAGVDIIEIDAIKILNNSDTYPLMERSEQWFVRENAPAARYTGVPDYYGVFGNKLRLGPVPDGVYQLTISAHAKLATLSTDAATNAWMVEGERLIRHQALAEIYRLPLRDANGIAFAKGGIDDAFSELKRKASGKTHGRIRPWGYV